MKIVEIGDRKIVVNGIGKMFYQDGFPISLSITYMQEQGIEVSVFHVADECMKNGWSGKTTFNKLKVDFADSLDTREFDLSKLETFCFASYEEQREIIYNYLFNESYDDVRQMHEDSNGVKFALSYLK